MDKQETSLLDGNLQDINLLSKAQLGNELAGGAGSIGSCFLLVFLDELDLAGTLSTAFSGLFLIPSGSNVIFFKNRPDLELECITSPTAVDDVQNRYPLMTEKHSAGEWILILRFKREYLL
jgi:hypothetical protein